ncbi:hypothetical protein [Clostridium cavendishii]|nr:hypothetical protein [Clostridium cavendishii]
MFRYDPLEEKQKQEEKQLFEDIKDKEKPKFKDLVAIMVAQYLIILPMLVIGIAIFGLILYLLDKFWLS